MPAKDKKESLKIAEKKDSPLKEEETKEETKSPRSRSPKL